MGSKIVGVDGKDGWFEGNSGISSCDSEIDCIPISSNGRSCTKWERADKYIGVTPIKSDWLSRASSFIFRYYCL